MRTASQTPEQSRWKNQYKEEKLYMSHEDVISLIELQGNEECLYISKFVSCWDENKQVPWDTTLQENANKTFIRTTTQPTRTKETEFNLWWNEESLYNSKCVCYRSGNKRVNAMATVNLFNAFRISVNSDDVVTKMHGLRVYYIATCSKVIAFQLKSGSEADDVLKVKWPYYTKLFSEW